MEHMARHGPTLDDLLELQDLLDQVLYHYRSSHHTNDQNFRMTQLRDMVHMMENDPSDDQSISGHSTQTADLGPPPSVPEPGEEPEPQQPSSAACAAAPPQAPPPALPKAVPKPVPPTLPPTMVPPCDSTSDEPMSEPLSDVAMSEPDNTSTTEQVGAEPWETAGRRTMVELGRQCENRRNPPVGKAPPGPIPAGPSPEQIQEQRRLIENNRRIAAVELRRRAETAARQGTRVGH